MKSNKIQSLLINHLLKHGHIQLRLPDNVVLEIGITEEDKYGNYKKTEDYCWVIAQKENRAACIDSYNLGIRFDDEEKALVLEDSFVDSDGNSIRALNVM
jgi:hypothetical protein